MKQFLFALLLFALGWGNMVARHKYAIQGIVCSSDSLPMENVAISSDNDSLIAYTDSLGRFEYVTGTLPIAIHFRSVGYISKTLYVDRNNYESLPRVIMDEEVIIDFFDQRGGLKVSAKELEKYGEYVDILVGAVFETDSMPLIGCSVYEEDKNGKGLYGTVTDVDGHFYLPLKKLPTNVEVRFVGCETKRFQITGQNVKEFQEIYLPADTNVIGCPEIITKKARNKKVRK